MSQITFDFPPRKNGGNHSRRRERNLAADLTHWIADLDAAEALRREQLHQIAELRCDVYRNAKARGVSPTMLRATRQLMRK